MRNRILAVITYAGADDLCKTRIDNWVKHVQPHEVLFSGAADKPFWSPGPSHKVRLGVDRYCDTHPESQDMNLPHRLTETLGAAISMAEDPMHAEVCLIEPDVWFWHSPWNNPPGFVGKQFQEADGRSFWHWPFVITGTGQARCLLATCRTLTKYGASCCPWGSFPDRFIGLAIDLAQIPHKSGNQASCNTVETEEQIQECLRAKAAGAYAVHGVKNQQVLERLL